MVTESIPQTIERYKIRANVFLKNNVRAFIIDELDNYYFCEILKVEEDFISVRNFKGRKEGRIETVYFIDINKLVEYKDLNELV